MIVRSLELTDFRNYTAACFALHPGVTAVVGLNGQGKTNVAEALTLLAALDSFRGAPTEAMIRVGAEQAVVRAVIDHADGREVTIDVALTRQGRTRAQVNRQPLQRVRDLLGVMRVTVFSPEDLAIIKDGPGARRRFLDDTLVSLAVKYDALRLDLERVLKQRNTLLKHAGGRLDDGAATTLDVWDARMAEVGDQFGLARATLVARLQPFASEAYDELADRSAAVELRYEPSWRQRGLAQALAVARREDLRRGTSTVGPHRDDVELSIGGLPARTHASQGEQRTLALALRLAAHRLVADRADSTPLLVLDDVLSELDQHRATALLRHLPPGQVVLTTAGALPEAAHPDAVVRISGGTIVDDGGVA